MDTREDRRARGVPELARLARTRDFRTSLARVTGQTTVQTFIPALPDDPMSYVLGQLKEAGGSAMLALLDEAGRPWRVALLWPASRARVEVAVEDDNLTQVHSESAVGMFFDYLQRVRTTVIQCSAAALVDEDEFQFA